MKTQEVQFDGNTYICRVVNSNEGEELLIGSTALLDVSSLAASTTKTRVLRVRKPKGSTTRFFLHGQKRSQITRRGPDCRTEAGQSRMVRITIKLKS